jgi:hypothetical protein
MTIGLQEFHSDSDRAAAKDQSIGLPTAACLMHASPFKWGGGGSGRATWAGESGSGVRFPRSFAQYQSFGLRALSVAA